MKLISLLLFSTFALADVKISQLPLGSAATTVSGDSFPYVDSVNNVTKRLTLYDIINIPALKNYYAPIASPTFTGTVTAPSFVGTLLGNVVGNVSGSAGSLSTTLAFSGGGTGQTTRQTAIDALVGVQTAGNFLRGNGVDVVMATIQGSDLPASGVTAGSYTNTNITVDASGRVTSAANGSSTGGASAALDNLTTTNINQNFNFNTGSTAIITTSDQATATAQDLVLKGGNVSGGTGNGGNLLLKPGTSFGGSAGQVQFQPAGFVAHPGYFLTQGTGSSGNMQWTDLSAAIDAAICTAQGSILYRSGSAWICLAPGTSGQFLQTQGGAANPQYASAVTSVNMTVPAFLSVTGGPITTSGTFAVSLSGSALPIVNGGTGATAASTARTSLNIDQRSTFSNADYTVLNTNRYVGQIGTMSAVRTATLPTAASVNAGQTLVIADESGTVTTTNTITIAASGSDTINGSATKTIRAGFGYIVLWSNGSNEWFTGVEAIGRGGTGLSTLPTNGQLLIGNTTTSSYALTTLTAGSGINVTNGAGTVSVASQLSSSPSQQLIFFGDGSDGTVSISSGTTTLTRDMYYSNLTISGTGSLNTASWRVYVKNTLTLDAAPANALFNGNAGGNNGTAAGSGGGNGLVLADATIGGGSNGSNGGAGSTTTGAQAAASTTKNGNGGGSNTGGAGGSSGANTGGAARAGGTTANALPIRRWATEFLNGTTLLGGGRGSPGGGGGAGDGTTSGGGGGGGATGGGAVYVSARIISRTGSTAAGAISANGGNGGNGGSPTAGTNPAGGGGASGSGGGWVYLAYGTLSGTTATNAISANGGSGGTGGNARGTGGGGSGGASGDAGRITILNLDAGTVSDTLGGAGASGSAASGISGGSGAVLNTFQVSL